jgi:hypothetical protein
MHIGLKLVLTAESRRKSRLDSKVIMDNMRMHIVIPKHSNNQIVLHFKGNMSTNRRKWTQLGGLCSFGMYESRYIAPAIATGTLTLVVIFMPVESHPDTQANFPRLASFIALTKSDTNQRVSRPFPSKSRFPPIPRAYFGFNVTMPWMQWKQ